MDLDRRNPRAERVPLDRRTWVQLGRGVRSFARSEVGGKAGWLLVALLALMLAGNGLNVLNSYVGRDFMTAIAQRDRAEFLAKALRYVGVFALSTVAAVILRYSEERLALLWREWLTRSLIGRYLDGESFYHLRERGEIGNPDQRIADDVRSFTTSTVSFLLLLLNGSLTILAFSGVLWSISPLLFAAALAYAATGSVLTIALGRPLVWLAYNQSDKEASLRADLVHVRENAESLVYLGQHARLRGRLSDRVSELAGNFRRMIAVNRNLGFFTTGYNYLIQLIPALIVAPMFMRGEVEFGVVPQSAIAFSHLLGAFSLIVTQFQSISSYAAAGMRLGALSEAAERVPCPEATRIAIEEPSEDLGYERLTVRSPLDGRILIRELSMTIAEGTRVLVSGPSEGAKLALFRATAGIWETGEGRILRPHRDRIIFLPERPYLPPGTLRQVLLPRETHDALGDDRVRLVLKDLGLETLVERVPDLDAERDWQHLLSLGEQQLVSVARILLAAPRFVLLQRIGTTLAPPQVAHCLDRFGEAGITYLTLGEGEADPARYDAVCELAADGSWSWIPLEPRGRAK